MGQITKESINNWFTYHPPQDDETRQKYEQIRAAGQEMAMKIFELTPPSADQTAAIRQVREAVMTANAAIACGGK